MSKFDELYKAVLKESKNETSVKKDAQGNKKYYLHSDDVKKNFKYTGELLRTDYGCYWIDENDDETEFVVKSDGEVVKA